MSGSTAFSQIATILTDNLTAVFDRLCTERYGGPLSLRRLDPRSGVSQQEVSFRLERTGIPPIDISFTVRPLGGNVYDVRGTIDNGPSHSFVYSLTDVPLPVPKAPRLTQDIATFLLNALERRLGQAFLRHATGNQPPTSQSTSAPSSSKTA